MQQDKAWQDKTTKTRAKNKLDNTWNKNKIRKDKTKVEEEKTKKLHTQKCVDLGAKRFWSRKADSL